VAALPHPASAQSPTIVPLSRISRGGNGSPNILGLSADGSTTVGTWSTNPARWDAQGAITELPMVGWTNPGNVFTTNTGYAQAVSADGAVIVGQTQQDSTSTSAPRVAVHWDAAGAVAEMPALQSTVYHHRNTSCSLVSGDGTHVAGQGSLYVSWTGNFVGTEALVWTPTALLQLTNPNTSAEPWARAAAISWDGAIVAGNWRATGTGGVWLGDRPAKWVTSTNTPTTLPTLGNSVAGFAHAEIRALSKYGEVAFGFSRKYDATGAELGQAAVYWDALGAIHEIVVPGTNGVALGCSDLGDVAFGSYVDANGTTRGFHWTLEEGAVDLGSLSPTGLCLPKDISGDGKTIVGVSTDVDSHGGAFVWRDGTMTALWSLLADEYQIDLPSLNWGRLEDAQFCSGDGSAIVGLGAAGNFATAHFRITIPVNEPPTIESDLVADQTYDVPLGSNFTANFDGEDEDGDDLTLEATGLPASVVLTPTAGTVSSAPAEAALTFEPTVADVGTHAVTIGFRDEAGVAASTSFTLNVPANAVPTLTTPAPVVVECAGEQNLVTLSTIVDDADPGHLLTVTWSVDGQAEQTDTAVLPGAVVEFDFDYPHGESVVTVEVTDGYDEATASSAVTVEDTTDPLIVLAGDIVVPTDEGEAFASNVVLPTPEVHDVCDAAPTLSNDAPTIYPLGKTIVTWTAVDDFGNVGTVTQKVTVGDVEAPSIVGGVDVTVPVDSGEIYATIVLPQPEAIDNVDPDVTIVSDEPATYPIGPTLVTWTATDAAGNAATWSLTVTVVNQAPVADAGGNLSLVSVTSAGLAVDLDGSASSDADAQDLSFVWSATGIVFDDPASPTPSATFPIGTTNVALTVTDEAGAQSTATIAVTVAYQPRRVVDTRQYGDETSFYVDQAAQLVTEFHAAMGYPSSYDWDWAIHYCYWSKYYDDLAESVTYDGEADYPTQLALYKSYRNPQVGCNQLLVTHFGRCSPGRWHPLYSQFESAKAMTYYARDYGSADYYQP
jgi:probable HAF family extracellular repeat protein